MIVRSFGGGPFGTSGYLLYDKEGGSAAVIDTPLGCTKGILRKAGEAGVKVLYVINTHGHWDSIADNVRLCEVTRAELLAHSWDSTRMAEPRLTSDEEIAKLIKPSRADRYIGEGDVIEVGDVKLQVWHTPGHSPGSLCLYNEEAGVIFTGDTLHQLGSGRTDIPGGSKQHMTRSLMRLSALPDATKVFPGHGLSTTIKAQRWIFSLVAEEVSGAQP